MRIAIDATPAVHQNAGIGRYTRSLIDALLKIDKHNWYTAFYAQKGEQLPDEAERLSALTKEHRNFSTAPIPLSDRALTALWNRIRVPVPLETFTCFCEMVHWTDFVIGQQRYGRAIVTVHDLTFLVVPECADRNLRMYLSHAVPKSAEDADAVIAVSQATKDDMVTLLGTDPQKIHVVHNGVGPEFQPLDPGTDQAVLDKYGLQNPFILSVGTIEPRKNYAKLLEAYRMLLDRGAKHDLVIAGKRGWLSESTFETVVKLKLDEKVLFIGQTSGSDLPALYRQAGVFVYPSLYEGFGIPPLEAMASGTPVVASNSSSLPEAVGEAGLLVDPSDSEALSGAIQILLNDDALAQEYARRGLERCQQFTWEEAARKLLEIYMSFADDPYRRR